MEPDEIRYEKTDVQASAVLRFGIVLALVTILVAVLLRSYVGYLVKQKKRDDRPLSPLASQEIGRRPPLPRLQERPREDVSLLRQEEERILSTYGTDERAGIVHIPIQEAMRILLAVGLPVRDEAEKNTLPLSGFNKSARAGEMK